MTKILLKIFKVILNILIFLGLSLVISKTIWNFIGNEYVFGKQPFGGDFFNALTYQVHFSKYFPNPASGWLPFWNEGWAVIGGYPFLSFYLTSLLTKFFDVVVGMNLFSIISLTAFFIFSLALFRQVSKNWLFALGLTAVLIYTRASYYQLTTGGFIVSASAQWYLPVVLFFLFRFGESLKIRDLILASLFSGISLLHHAPTSLLMIFAPSVLFLAFSFNSKLKTSQKLIFLLIFIGFSFMIGLGGLYTFYLQNFMGTGTDACNSPQCWGIYPKHLITWLNPAPLALVTIFLVCFVVSSIVKKRFRLNFIIAAFSGFSVFALYALAAHLKLINSQANVIPPTRTFWAANFFALFIACAFFYYFQKLSRIASYVVSLVVLVGIIFYFYNNPVNIHKYQPYTVPQDAASYVISNYRTKKLSELVPDFIPINEPNWRVDIFNPGIIQWWNIPFQTPTVRGYSNNALGVHRDWQYFLQVATRDPKNKNTELIANEALFLIDAFGIGFIDNSTASYPTSLLKDPQLMIKYAHLRDFDWFKLSPEKVTPIVLATNAPAVLFVGDDLGYQNFIRTLSMVNLNSFWLIPVKGPKNFDQLSSNDFKQFKAIILYRFEGKNWSKLESFVKNGGSLFVDTGSTDQQISGNLPAVFPINSTSKNQSKGPWNAKLSPSEISNQIQGSQFSDLSFKGGFWRLSTTSEAEVRSFAKPVISKDNQVLLVEGKLGQGNVVWSGINLFYHIVDNENLEEGKLFKNIVSSFIHQTNTKPNYEVKRPAPENILVDGQNFSGIYFKENFDPGWKASVNGSETKVYKAGLEFMYIPVFNIKSDERVILEYKGNLVVWLIFLLSISSILFSLIFLIIPSPFILLKNKFLALFKKNLVKLVHEEE